MAEIKVTVTLKKTVEDAEGQSVLKALKLLGYNDVNDVRTGKIYYISLRRGGAEQGREFCKKLLSNPIINECAVDEEK